METQSEKNIGEITFGEGFCKCCQPQIIGMIYINVDEMCFIPINVHDSTVQCCSSDEMAKPFACSYNIFYVYQTFILSFHKSLHPDPPSLFLSLSVHMSLSFFLWYPIPFS